MDRNRSKQIKPSRRATAATRALKAAAAVATTLLFAVMFGSCAKEATIGERSLPDGAVRIVLSVGDTKSRAANDGSAEEEGSDEENAIANIKVLFYDNATQKLDIMYAIDDVAAPDADADIEWQNNSLIIKRGVDQTKSYDVYVVANWTEGFNANDFAKGSSIGNLTEAFIRIAGQIVVPDATHHLLMSGSATNHVFVDNVTATVALVRQVAKLRINVQIGADFQVKYPDAVFGAAASPDHNQLTVYNIPNSSYVYGTTDESRYNTLMAKEGSKLLDYPTVTMTPAAAGTGDVYETETVYVYENITLGTTAQAKEKATFMVLRLPYKLTEGANAVTENYYKFYVQDNADRTDPHKTRRNHIYDLTATVVGFGKEVPDIGGVTITTKVLPWGYVSIADSDGEYLVVDETPKTLTFNLPQEITFTASDLSKVTITAANNKVEWTRSGNKITVNVKLEEANNEFVDDIDKLTIAVGHQQKVVPINYQPSMAQRFAKGMIVSDGAGGVTIAAPNADRRGHLLFVFGNPIGLKPAGNGQSATIAYNPCGWSGGLNFNPGGGNDVAYHGSQFDYIEHLLDPNNPGKVRSGSSNPYAGDVCRIMGKKDGHYWRIPTINEWKALFNEGKKAVSMNGVPLGGSTTPDADFGWFLGLTATTQTKDNAANPSKGSVFVYSMIRSDGVPNYITRVNISTLDIMSSSFMSIIPSDPYPGTAGYITANGLDIYPSAYEQYSLALPVRCIRDYSRK